MVKNLIERIKGLKNKVLWELFIAIAFGFTAISRAKAQTEISIEPQAPTEVAQGFTTVVGWGYWIAWIAVFGVTVFGAINVARGDTEGDKKYLIGGIVAAIILGALTAILNALSGGKVTFS